MSFMTVIIILLVIGGWTAIILKDLPTRGESKGRWVHGVAAIVFGLLIIWIVTSF